MTSRYHRWIICCALFVAFFQPNTAFAYIDPNAGGMLFQLLAPLFAALIGTWMFLRRWIAGLFRRLWRRLIGHSGKA